MIHGSDIVIEARKWRGVKYRFGVEVVNGSERFKDPKKYGWDCSEFIEYVLSVLGWFDLWIGMDMVFDGSYNQYTFCKKKERIIDLDEARGTSGALVFRRDTETGQMEHVAFTTDINTTIEARGRNYGTGEFEWRANWTDAALIPGVKYKNA